jgi:hypothetical protein
LPDPLVGLDWEVVLAACPRLISFDRLGSFPLRARHFAVRKAGQARGPGGIPYLPAAVTGFDRETGLRVAAIPMQCGGTMGVTGILVFIATDSGPVLVDEIRHECKMGALFIDGRLHIVSAKHARGDCNAFPSAHAVREYAVFPDRLERRSESVLATKDYLTAYRPHFEAQTRLLRAAV